MKLIVTVVALFAIAGLTKAKHTTSKPLLSRTESLKPMHRSPAHIVEDKGKAVETKWMTQPLDHFDKHNKRTWRMRYMVNEQYFKNGGPIFIYVGGENGIAPGAIQSGIFSDLAREHNAILFRTEHRYYGQSIPTRDLSNENLKFLQTKQALADLALFIRSQRTFDFRLANSKVIIAGGSYAGSLVIWFSKLYPDLVNGGWASSAPVLAKVDFIEYNEISGKALRELGSQQCYNRIQNGIAELEDMLEDDRWAEAKAMLLLCNDFDHNNSLDLWSLFFSIIKSFTKVVQEQTGADIYNSCNYLMSFEDDLTAVIASFIVKNFFGQDCVDVTYKSLVNTLTNLSPRSGKTRAWFYQLCNEFGWFQSTYSRSQPFGTKAPAALQLTLCYDVFGPKYTFGRIRDLVAETNKFFSGKEPNVENIYITHGALDPWSPLGLNETYGASIIPRTSHCSDFTSISDSDSPEMLASKQRLVHLVREWLT